MSKADKLQQIKDMLQPRLKMLGFSSVKRYKVGEPIKDADLFKCTDNGHVMPYKKVRRLTPTPCVWKICR